MAEPPPTISDAHIIAIGRLVVAVSKIDILLTDVAAALLGINTISAIATIHHQQIASKIDTLKALARLQRANDILPLLSDAGAVADYRNKLVHAAWTVSKEGETYAVRFQARGELKRSRVPVAPEQILAKSRLADEIADQLGELRDRLVESRSRRRDRPNPPQP